MQMRTNVWEESSESTEVDGRKKRSHLFLETPFGPLLVICYKFSLSLTFFYIAENMPIGVGKNAPKYMQQQSELLISNPSLFTWQIASQEMTSEV